MTNPVAKIRTCGECKKTFVNADSFRKHKHKFGGCRSDEGMLANGFEVTKKGWRYVPQVGQDGIRYIGL